MLKLVLVLLQVNLCIAAPPEISLTIHRVVDEDQNLNETLVVHATHDMIILEASDVLDNNGTDIHNGTDSASMERKSGSVPLTRLTRGAANITTDEKGNVVVQLPTKGNATTDVVVGSGTHVVNQIVSGELAVESKGGW